MELSKLQKTLLQQRYLLKDENKNVIENSDQMFRRVANAIVQAEKNYKCPYETIRAIAEDFYQIMAKGLFLPNSPTLMNAGRKNGMLSACFVLPVLDSIEGIFDAVKATALIQRAGGGTGFAFDTLRPTGDMVASSGGKTSGPISFWKVFAETTNAIQQGAHRRGANMAMMSIYHPDILKFINAKNDLAKFSNFNISVKIDDKFMETLLDYPDVPHRVMNPRTEKFYFLPRTIDIDNYIIDDLLPTGKIDIPCYTTSEIWEMIVKNAHATGEPGICYIDRINENNPTPNMGRIEACNPCGEQPLLDFESCNLGSIDVSKFVSEKEIDWELLEKTVSTAVRFLDDVIDVSHYPIRDIQSVTLSNRKIGLGIMGFADALIQLGIRYDSPKALDTAVILGEFIQTTAHQASEKLAWEKGRFINYNCSIWDKKHARPMRNAACTTIAPTGSISILTGCSSGIEPVFKFAYQRSALDGQKFIELHPLIERLSTTGGWMDDSVREKLLQGVSPEDIEEIPKELSSVMVTAHQVPPQWHVKIQAAFQAHVDNAVSKTVNLPADAKTLDVDEVYKLAFKLGCKGITVYRDNARDNQVFKAVENNTTDNQPHSLKPRQQITTGKTIKYRIGCGTLFVTVNKDENGLCEVFANLGKAGGCPSQSEATCRAISAALRSGVKPEILIEQLKSIRCLSTIAGRKTNKDIDVLSCPDAIATALQQALGYSEQSPKYSSRPMCPECGFTLRKEAGCNVCDNCGYSKCS
ncbi:MAG: adenosylcobalamin-dependent ribonucleoside-diphosphate reductase [Sedimentisphaerales bacterium]|nr:adenosylcobalamin-dependent ribonucleoside-diphosphate reductase [Sedimentisphaerales bacterium]